MNQIKIFILSLIFVVSCKSVGSDLDIIGGSFVDEKDYPTVVRVLDMNKNFRCSGVIVSENVVLTAAHCLIESMLINKSTKKIDTVIFSKKYVVVNGIFIEGTEFVILPQYGNLKVEEDNVLTKKMSIDDNYEQGKISRIEYESQVEELQEKLSYPLFDLGAIIFQNGYFGWGTPPFKSVIKEAKKKEKFFSLSKNPFPNDKLLEKDKKSLFFLGYGRNNTYNNLNDIEEGNKYIGKLQIGYNALMYSKNTNEWYTPEPIKSSRVISQYIYNGANTAVGDSGGPLIYKNQILGVASRVYQYDCDGNNFARDALSDHFFGIDPETGKKKSSQDMEKDSYAGAVWYISTSFASITLGSNQLIAEYFIREVQNRLAELDLLKNGTNSIFSTLVEK